MADKNAKTPAASAGEFLSSARDNVVGAAGNVVGAVQETGKAAGTGIVKGVDAAGDYLNKTLPTKPQKEEEAAAAAGGGIGGAVGDCVNKAKGLFGAGTTQDPKPK